MNALYELVNISKQAHLAHEKRRQILEDKWLLLESILEDWRERHPCMSLKKLYLQIKPDFIGRNNFIAYGMENGFEAVRYSKPPKTTFTERKQYAPNLLIDFIIYDINQVWVSDITYFNVLGKWYYVTFIMDLYSRKIIGYFAAENLFAQANLEALNIALKNRKMTKFKERLIHHSDRGSQYDSFLYKSALKKAEIRISMGKIVYDNIHIERVNQTMKGEYLSQRNIRSYNDLIKYLKQDVYLYNNERPHHALGMKTPSDFERYISNMPLCQRTPMRVFALKKKNTYKKEQPVDINQLVLPFESVLP